MNTRAHVVLVVEDEESDRILIAQAFQACRPTPTIHAVANGHEAIAYLMGEGKFADRSVFPYPSYILTDLSMPVMDGFDVLEHLKSNPSWAVIPAVVFSSSDDPDDVRTSYALGASSYVAKPVSFDEMKARIKTIHSYWLQCCVPEVDEAGQQRRTHSKGKLGERYPQSPTLPQHRVPTRKPPS